MTVLLIHGIIWINTNEEGKRMRRRIIVSILASVVMLTLMACGGGESGAEGSTGAESKESE